MERVFTNLNQWASELVLGTLALRLEGSLIYPDGRREPVSRTETRLLAQVEVVESHSTGPLDCWYLHRYTLPSGEVYVEYVQQWDSDDGDTRVSFIALKDAMGNVVPRSVWTQTEMDTAMGRKPRGWLEWFFD